MVLVPCFLLHRPRRLRTCICHSDVRPPIKFLRDVDEFPSAPFIRTTTHPGFYRLVFRAGYCPPLTSLSLAPSRQSVASPAIHNSSNGNGKLVPPPQPLRRNPHHLGISISQCPHRTIPSIRPTSNRPFRPTQRVSLLITLWNVHHPELAAFIVGTSSCVIGLGYAYEELDNADDTDGGWSCGGTCGERPFTVARGGGRIV